MTPLSPDQQSPAAEFAEDSATVTRRMGWRHRRILREGMWVAGGQLVAAVATLVGTRLITEVVPPAVFGQTSLLLGLFMIVRWIFGASTLQAYLRLYSEAVASGHLPALRRVTGHFLTKSTAALSAALLLAGLPFAEPGGLSYAAFPALAVLLALDVARTFDVDSLSAARRQAVGSLWRSGEAVLKPLAVLAAVWYLGSTSEAMLVGQAASVGLSLMAVRGCLWLGGMRSPGAEITPARGQQAGAATAAPPAKAEPDFAAQIWRYALPLAPLAVLAWITGLSDRYFIRALVNEDAVGVYAAIYGLVSYPFLTAQTMIDLTLRPVYFEAAARGRADAEARIFRAALWLTLSVGGAGIVGFTLLHGVLAAVLLAEPYRAGAGLMPWLAAGFTLQSLAQVIQKRHYVAKRTDLVLSSEAAAAVACLLFQTLLIGWFGLLGAALAPMGYFGVQVFAAAWLGRTRPGSAADPPR